MNLDLPPPVIEEKIPDGPLFSHPIPNLPKILEPITKVNNAAETG